MSDLNAEMERDQYKKQVSTLKISWVYLKWIGAHQRKTALEIFPTATKKDVMELMS